MRDCHWEIIMAEFSKVKGAKVRVSALHYWSRSSQKHSMQHYFVDDLEEKSLLQ